MKKYSVSRFLKLRLFIPALFLILTLGSSAQSIDVQKKMKGFDQTVEKILKDWNVPGCGIGIVVKDKLVYARGYGYRDLENKYLRRLNDISPLDTQRILNIGELEISRGNTSQAEEMFEQVMKIAKREAADMLSNLSSRIATICANRDPEMAIRYSKRALDLRGGDLSPSDIATVNILGISLRKQGKWREAIAEYRRVLAVVPDNPGLLYNMAMAYNEGGDVPKALNMVRKALEIDPGLAGTGKNVAYNIGVIFERSGLSGEPYFKKAYEQDPNDKTMWEALKRSQAMA